MLLNVLNILLTIIIKFGIVEIDHQESSKVQKFKSSKVQKFKSSKVQKFKSSKVTM